MTGEDGAAFPEHQIESKEEGPSIKMVCYESYRSQSRMTFEICTLEGVRFGQFDSTEGTAG